nr:hypothetical protein SHINE37_40857 [Rhizobiaceae bacterium]
MYLLILWLINRLVRKSHIKFVPPRCHNHFTFWLFQFLNLYSISAQPGGTELEMTTPDRLPQRASFSKGEYHAYTHRHPHRFDRLHGRFPGCSRCRRHRRYPAGSGR